MRVDTWKLSRERGSIEGNIDAQALARVADRLASGPAAVAWRLSGTIDAEGHPAVEIELNGEVTLACQRCLGRLGWPVRYRSMLLLAASESALEALDARTEAEVVLAAVPLDPLELVEDELVLALPFAPRHPEGACIAPADAAAPRKQ